MDNCFNNFGLQSNIQGFSSLCNKGKPLHNFWMAPKRCFFRFERRKLIFCCNEITFLQYFSFLFMKMRKIISDLYFNQLKSRFKYQLIITSIMSFLYNTLENNEKQKKITLKAIMEGNISIISFDFINYDA